MRRDDYILRLISEFVRAIHRLTGLAREGRHQAALDSIDQAARQVAGASLAEIVRMGSGELLARLSLGETDDVARDRSAFVAALLQSAAGNAGALHDDHASDQCFLAALRLSLAIHARFPQSELPEYMPDIRTLVGALGLYRLPLEIYGPLLLFYERQGSFAAAEDALHALLDAVPDDQAALERGVEFYRRLLAFDDTTLRAGDLSRAEVQYALAELEQRKL
jgi:hypothetical protein